MSDKVLPTIYNFNFNTVFLSNETVHLLDDFKCGAGEIDRYVKEDALNDCMSGKGVTYLVIDNSSERLVAYYTLSATSLIYVEDYDITDKSNFNDIKIRGIPSIEIKMFAVNNSYQDILLHHEEHGEKLISDVILGSVIGGIYDIAIKILGAEMKKKFIDLKQKAANRSPVDLGTKVKNSEVIYHHEVYNQMLWNDF